MDKKDDLFSADLFGEETEQVTEVAQEEAPVEASEAVTEAVAEVAAEPVETVEEVIEETVDEEPAKLRLEEQPVQTGDDGERLTLAHFASHAYLEYAMSVVKGRALPDICDGQKPVQRRILYAMHEMGLGPDAKPVKSARVVGNVLGKYHPHGDSAAYEAMVRMAQDFNMRYPLVLGQGNFGSRDGDGAAAMRYTEAHLTKISRLLLEEIKEGTVDFIPNYDGAFKEPTELPARLPFGLLNGSSGIAVGMATEIPSHNLKEVAAACMMLLDNPESTLDDILTVLPAPDFPMGGQIISKPSEIRDAYATGRGSLKVRARYEFEDMQRGHWRLIVKELPPNTSAQKVLNEIEEITNPKVRPGKKALSAEQQQTKAAMLAILDGVRDESGKEEATRLVFEPKSKNQNRQDFVNALLAQTSMEGNVSMNLVMVGLDGKPRQKTLLQILKEWVQFRVTTVRRRTQFRLDKTLDRIHILEGRRLVYLNLDDVIAIIREADDPKAALMAKYPLSERQTDDILEIRLRQLARLEGIKIDAELAQLNKTRDSLERLLNSEKLLVKQVSKEIAADAQEFGDERRTLVEEANKAELTQTVVDEPVTVIVSQKGYIRARTGHGHDASIMSYKMGDAYSSSYECRTTDNLVAVSNTGRVYTIAVADLPSARGDGLPINSFIELEKGTQLVAFCVAKPEAVVLFSSTEGMGFVCHFKDLIARLRAGKAFMKLGEHAKILPPQVVREGEDKLACLSQEGRLLIFDLSEVRTLAGGGMGVKLMDLNLGEKLIVAKPITSAGVMVMGEGRGGKVREYAVKRAHYDNHVGRRARKGKQLDIRWKATKLVDLPAKNPNDAEDPVEPMTENGELSLI